MNLIIYCHPSHNSHSGKILEQVKASLDKKHKKYEVIDLYKEDFQAYLTKTEHERIQKRERLTENDVEAMQKKITEASTLIFIYPVWWYGMPARLKGFMDRVFTSGFAYRFKKVNWIMLFGADICSRIPGVRYLLQPYSAQGNLKGKKALIFRTYGGPKLGKRLFGNMPAKLEHAILRFCGITNIKTHELFNIDKSQYTQEYEDRYMQKVNKLVN